MSLGFKLTSTDRLVIKFLDLLAEDSCPVGRNGFAEVNFTPVLVSWDAPK